MKLLFASDISFNEYEDFPGQIAVNNIMGDTAKLFRDADFSMINLENIFGEKEKHTQLIKSGPRMISKKEFISFLDCLNPTAIGLANNHCLDYSEKALLDTIDLLKENGYMTVGAGKSLNNAYEPILIDKDDNRIAIMAICENEPGVATCHTGGSAGYNLYRVSKSICALKEKGYLPIIFFHGGNEGNPFPSPEKVGLYRHFIDIGAKAVIAMHTHCPQGYEMYHDCPIVYSMGNFFFPYNNEHKSWYYGYLTQLHINGGKFNIEIHPYKFDFHSHVLLDGAEKDHFMKYIVNISSVIKDEKRLREFFDSWCVLPELHYLRELLQYSDEMLKKGPRSVMAMKNILCCEAHNELVRNVFRIMYEGNFEAAGKHIKTIKMLQNMELPALYE